MSFSEKQHDTLTPCPYLSRLVEMSRPICIQGVISRRQAEGQRSTIVFTDSGCQYVCMCVCVCPSVRASQVLTLLCIILKGPVQIWPILASKLWG